ncbi:MAG: ATP-binding protein [Desulfobacterales bacterium]|nr:ATP-binding protein [Desulfobacterales bacterium]
MPRPDDKDALHRKIRRLETEVKHLRNELSLSRTEYQNLIDNYYDIFSNQEKMVEERTRELHQVKSQLENKTRELQIMLDSSPALIFFKDSNGRYIRANKRFADFLNIAVKDIIGHTHRDLFPAETLVSVFTDDSEVIRSGTPHLHKHARVDTPEGAKSIVIDKIPYKNTQDEVIGIIGFALDVTQQEVIQKEKEELQQKLARSQKMESLGLLAGGVAHDLNNVLTGFVSYPELLLMELPADSPLRDPIRTIQESGHKAAAIVQDLLTLARRGVNHTVVLNLNEVIAGYVSSPEHRRLTDDFPHVKVKMHLAGDLLNVNGADVHLRKTVMNLVYNAYEAQPDGGAVTVKTYNCYVDKPLLGYDNVEEGDYAVLEIRDEGVGIDPEDLNRIFEPFYSRKTMGRSGTGLGMAVVWGTVQDHEGYIDVQSRIGYGTVFKIYFPATRELPAAKSKPLPMKAYMGRGESILVVDDIEAQREIAAGLLGKLNYAVSTAASGEEAVALSKTRPCDLLVLDMIMESGMDGLDTYRRILEIRPGQKAIIASGFSETARVREAQSLGAGAYVKKPYLLEKIGVAVREELDRASDTECARQQSPIKTGTC